MLVLKIWGLPKDSNEGGLRHLHRQIVAAVVAVTELGLKTENDMTVLFPSDLMEYGLGSEIVVEISGPLRNPVGMSQLRCKLAAKVGGAVQSLFPKANVKCLVQKRDPGDGFWSSGIDVN